MLEQATIPGCPDGMNMSVARQEIEDSEAFYLQDVLLDTPGVLRTRGALDLLSGWTQPTHRVVGLARAYTPAGTERVATVDMNGNARVYNASGGAALVTLTALFGTQQSWSIFDCKPALGGGTWIGCTDTYDNTATQCLALWRGAGKATYTTGAISTSGDHWTPGHADYCKVSGSSNGNWTTSLEPGMFLLTGTGELLGVIKSIPSASVLFLEQPALTSTFLSGVTYTAQSFRGYQRTARKGFITCATGSPAVTGVGTAFGSIAGWQLFRASDRKYIGLISTVTNDFAVTLTGNAAVSLQNESYVATPPVGGARWQVPLADVNRNEASNPGMLTAIWAGRQWNAFRSGGTGFDRLAFSDPDDAEATDYSATGDWFPVTSIKPGASRAIRALMPTSAGLLVFKRDETFIVTGNDVDDFRVDKLNDDGCHNAMAAVSWGADVLSLGTRGLWHFEAEAHRASYKRAPMDGANPVNVTRSRLGTRGFFSNLDSSHMMRVTVYADHLLMHNRIGGLVSATPASGTDNPMMACLYLPGMALSMFSAPFFDVAVPESAYAAVYDEDALESRLVDLSTLFGQIQAATTDTDAVSGIGPQLTVMTKLYDLGDAMRKKLFRQLAVTYLSQTYDLDLYVQAGVDNQDEAQTATSFVHDATKWTTKRVKFLRRNRHIGFTIVASTPGSPVSIDSWAVGYKLQRPGRV